MFYNERETFEGNFPTQVVTHMAKIVSRDFVSKQAAADIIDTFQAMNIDSLSMKSNCSIRQV